MNDAETLKSQGKFLGSMHLSFTFRDFFSFIVQGFVLLVSIILCVVPITKSSILKHFPVDWMFYLIIAISVLGISYVLGFLIQAIGVRTNIIAFGLRSINLPAIYMLHQCLYKYSGDREKFIYERAVSLKQMCGNTFILTILLLVLFSLTYFLIHDPNNLIGNVSNYVILVLLLLFVSVVSKMEHSHQRKSEISWALTSLINDIDKPDVKRLFEYSKIKEYIKGDKALLDCVNYYWKDQFQKDY